MTSKRTIITIAEEQKTWLKSYSKAHNVSMAEAVRRGIHSLKELSAKDTYQMLIRRTEGVWKKGDGLKYQQKIRAEWNDD